ncbi:YppG family protein [Bacillus suaedaesalsae]|uniref:YppG family protein n=1 Tax=Bacillus suaedaesalsae TaxID=2810349 RepID=A0ABS2DMW6_9BACI|nr:YppG family protein [Bacillus suaedaesalsae]MBM6619814.1 YppG family protein [Bacillus suaedaesalsae]
MFGIKEKRRMVRNPFMNSNSYYPYQGHSNQPLHLNQQYYQQPYPTMNQHSNTVNSYMWPQTQNMTPFQMPYPVQAQKAKPNPNAGFNGILNQFKTKDGVYDVNKMMSTAGQMMNTVNQLNGMVKQVGALFKTKV